VEAELTEVNGLRLVFSFIARVWNPDEDLVVGAGSMERLVVNKERFLAGARPAST
jgi:predicted thioesterase